MGAIVFFWQERQRLYYLLPDVASAQEMMNELLLARIEARHMHFLAKRGTPLNDLPEASVFQKTDIVPGAERGMVIGAVAGLLGGILVVLFPPGGITLQVGAVLIGAILGALFGAWASSMAASAVPNSKLKEFQSSIEQGQILMMVDVPVGKAQAIHDLVESKHPEAASRGVDATYTAFP